jgi:hypothetical protein
MTTRRILLGLIIVTTLIFALVYTIFQQYLIAALALAAGLIWFKLEHDHDSTFVTLFFLWFLSLAILGSLNNLFPLWMLLGLCANLAAWDLSRLQARVTDAGRREIEPMLESRHLRWLFVAIGSGLLLAVLSTFVRISVNFVIFAVLTLLAMLILRASVFYLREE